MTMSIDENRQIPVENGGRTIFTWQTFFFRESVIPFDPDPDQPEIAPHVSLTCPV
jgi:hypothetical protein